MNTMPRTSRRAWLQAWLIDRRARRHIAPTRLARLIGLSTAWIRHAEGVRRVQRNYAATAAWSVELRLLLVELVALRRRRDAAQAAADSAAEHRLGSDLAAGLWIAAWLPVTLIDFNVTNSMIEELVPGLTTQTARLVTAGLAAGTLLVGHEVGSAIQTWRRSSGELTVQQRRRSFAAVAMIVSFAALLHFGITATTTASDDPTGKRVAVGLMLFATTALYSVKPNVEFTRWAAAAASHCWAHMRFARTRRRVIDLTERIVEGRDQMVLTWWSSGCYAKGDLASWGELEAAPSPEQVSELLDHLEASGVGLTRVEFDTLLSDVASCMDSPVPATDEPSVDWPRPTLKAVRGLAPPPNPDVTDDGSVA